MSGRGQMGRGRLGTATSQGWARWTLWALVAGGVALRLWRLDAQPLWLDEASSWAYAARGPWAGTLWSEVIHPPLERLLLRAWLGVIPNDGEGWLRLLPALCGCGALAAWAWLWTEAQGCDARTSDETTPPTDATRSRPARLRVERLWVVGAVALSPFLVAYSQELRMYALLHLWVALGFAATLRWIRTGSATAGAGAVAAGLLGMYTHYFAALSWVGALCMLAGMGWRVGWTHPQGPRRALRQVAAGVAVAALLYSPWAWYVITHYQPVTRSGAGMWEALGYVLLQHTAGPGLIVFDTLRWEAGIRGTHWIEWLLLSLWLLTCTSLAVAATRTLRHPSYRARRWAILGGWLAPMTLGLLIMQPLSGLLRPHYLIGAAPFWLTLLGLGAASSPPPQNTPLHPLHPLHPTRHTLPKTLGALLLVAGLVGYFGGGQGWSIGGWTLRYSKERWRDAAAEVRALASPRAWVLLTPSYLAMPFGYYDRDAHPWLGLDDESPTPDADLAQALAAAGEPAEVWLLISHRWYNDTYIDALTRAGWTCTHSVDYPAQWGIRLRAFRRLSSPPTPSPQELPTP